MSNLDAASRKPESRFYSSLKSLLRLLMATAPATLRADVIDVDRKLSIFVSAEVDAKEIIIDEATPYMLKYADKILKKDINFFNNAALVDSGDGDGDYAARIVECAKKIYNSASDGLQTQIYTHILDMLDACNDFANK